MVPRRQKPIYAFIDSQNLNLGVRSQGWKLDVSGDGDFFCLVEYLNKKDKLARIVIPNKKKYSQFYVRFKDKALFVSDIKSKVSRQ